MAIVEVVRLVFSPHLIVLHVHKSVAVILREHLVTQVMFLVVLVRYITSLRPVVVDEFEFEHISCDIFLQNEHKCASVKFEVVILLEIILPYAILVYFFCEVAFRRSDFKLFNAAVIVVT